MDDREPTLVAVPGLGLSADTVTPTFAALGRRSAQSVCLPGYGRPAPPRLALTPSRLAQMLIAELETRQVPSPWVLMGHSSSCQLVTEAAARAADRVAGLVLVGPTTDPRAVSWLALAMRWLATASFEEPRQIPLLLRAYHRTGLFNMKAAMDASRKHRLEEAIAGVRCPLLIVRGRDDFIVPEDWAKTVAARGHGTAVTLPVGAHMLPITHPGHLATAIAPMLR